MGPPRVTERGDEGGTGAAAEQPKRRYPLERRNVEPRGGHDRGRRGTDGRGSTGSAGRNRAHAGGGGTADGGATGTGAISSVGSGAPMPKSDPTDTEDTDRSLAERLRDAFQ